MRYRNSVLSQREIVAVLFKVIICLGLFLSIAMSGNITLAQDGNIDYDITLSPTTVDTGETITYEFSSSCSGVTGGCDDFTINIDYDETQFEFVSSSIDSADGDAFISDDGSSFTVQDPTYGDGDGFTATVTLRALQTLTTGTTNIPSTVTATSNQPGGSIDGPSTVPDITINDPDLRYDVRKTQILPAAGTDPAVNDGGNGAFVRYNVQYCATQSTDVLPITDAVLVDRLPDGVNVLEDSGATTIIQTSPPSAVSGTFLVWNIGDLDGSSGCISRTVEYEFPTAAGFVVSSDGTTTPSTTNTVNGFYNGQPADVGVCTTDCVGTTSESPTLDAAFGTPNVFKSVRDDRPVAFPGNNEFTFGFNTNDLNVTMSNIIIGDDIPTESGEPSSDVYEVFSGQWADGLPATLRIFFENGDTDEFGVDGSGATITYGDAQTGGSAVASGVTSSTTTATRDITSGSGNRITRVELEFPSVPQAFTMGSRASLTYTVNPDVVTGEIVENNCATASYSSPPNPTPSGTPEGCADTTLTNDTSSVVNYSKGASPSSVDNTDGTDDFIDFTITLEFDQQSSSNFSNVLTYTDTLPDVLDFVAQDETPFATGDIPFTFTATNLVVADNVPDPYIRIIDGTSDVLEFYWTDDVSTLPYPVYDSAGNEYTSSAGTPTNEITLTPPLTGSKDLIVTYTAQVKDVADDAYAGTYTNNVIADAGSISLICDGATSETQTCDTDSDFSIISVDAFEAAKWVRSNFLPVLNVRADRLSYEDDSPQFAVNTAFACTTPVGLDEVLRNDSEPLPPDPTSDPPETDNNISGDGVYYSRTPCVAQGNPGESFEYLIEITNRGNNQLNEFIFYDILPYIGDTGVNQAVAGVNRLSEFEVWLNGAVTVESFGSVTPVASDFLIEYSTSTDPCRPEMSSGTGINDWQSCGSFSADSSASSMTRNPRSFRIEQVNNTLLLDPDSTMVIRIPVYIPTSTDLTNAGLAESTNEAERALTGEIAWNSFAYRFRSNSTGNLLLTASPRKVGIRIPERLSVGNRVWIDDGDDGAFPADYDDREFDLVNGELGVENVVLELYRYTGPNSSVPANDAGTAPDLLTDVELIARTLTDADGFYLFETDQRASPDSDGGFTLNGRTFAPVTNVAESPYDWINNVETWSLRPGSYFIYLPPVNFTDDYNNDSTIGDLGPLYGYFSSTGFEGSSGNGASDSLDRGTTGFDGSIDDPANFGVVSDWFDLEFYTDIDLSGEPIGTNANPLNEDDLDIPDEGPYGRGSLFQKDQFSDLVRDFGFVQPMSIGNRVWLDNGAVTADTVDGYDPALFNNGIVDGDEVGIENVTVQLYGDFDRDGTEDTTPISTLTDTNGYYLFDGLPPGDYRVVIPASNFASGGELEGMSSSYDAVAPDDLDPDNDDHGGDTPAPFTTDVSSPVIELSLGTEPTTGDDETGTGTGSNGELDINSDLTVDFGFVPVMSIGNRVWLDDGAVSGGFDPTQFDDGILNGTEAGINNVTVNLYFEGPSGFTQISTTQTSGGGYYIFDNLPEGTYYVEIPTSEFSEELTGHFSSTDLTAPADGDADNDDHGIDVGDPTTTVTRSPNIVLSRNGETQADDEAVTDTNDNTPPEIADNNSDLTVDFGFIRPMGLGNRVWEDIDRATGILGDGIRQATELGIGGVEVRLYADDGDGDFDITLDTLISITSTSGSGFSANNGYYLFDRMSEFNDRRLGQGDYFVHIPQDQFDPGGVLENFINSNVGAAAAGTDNGIDSVTDGGDENGVNPTPLTPSTYPVNAGVTSTEIQLRYDSEPPATATTEGDFDPNLPANYNGENVQDANGDLTIDFGFYQGLAIGNRVWYDSNRNGQIDGGDTNPGNTNVGIPGVTVYLYLDDGTGTPTGTPLATDVTDSEGYYIFDEADTGDLLLPDEYVVAIDYDLVSGINATPLQYMISTITRADASETPLATGEDAEVDNDDNGLDQRDPGSVPNVIYSEVIDLSHLNETIAEADGDKETGVGDGSGVQDNNSDLTVDFGFFIPVSIGNRIWYDFGSGTPANDNNALLDPGETGVVDGVIVELFRGTSISGTPYRQTVTVTDSSSGEAGYYLFDDLPEGDYIVRIAPENFQPDDGTFITIDGVNYPKGALTDMSGAPYSSSESGGATEAAYLLDVPSANMESNDNGVDENFPQTNGIRSNVINLTRTQEPDGNGEDDDDDHNSDVTTNGGPEGRFTETDENANLTIDFGVYAPLMSIGNRVFYDYDNDRIFNNADAGVPNVVVNLFFDTDGNGIPDSGINNPIATTTTDSNGFYLFDGLSAGQYLVQVDETNFRTTGNPPLRDFYSSQDKANPTDTTQTLPLEEDDLIESGVDDPFSPNRNPDLQAEGVFSPTIVLEPSNEPIDEDTIGGLGPEGDGEPNIQPSNSDLTVDFGFYQPMSIGNVVWFDTEANGLFDSTEAGISGVEVTLYRDNGDGVFSPTSDTVVPVFDGTDYVPAVDITDDEGYYLFDNLLAGNYFVNISSTNFTSGVLIGHRSTTPDNATSSTPPAPTSDSNDNGTPNTNNAVQGVTSELIQLGTVVNVGGTDYYIPSGSEPTLEFDKSNNPSTPADEYDGPASIGRYGEIDSNSDITIDFGFVLEDDSSMSIGNRVWFDTNHNGLVDAGDDNPDAPGNPGIENVVVLLYRANTSGSPIGNAIARDITNSEGYYLFDVLDTDATTAVGEGDGLGGPVGPGNYVVVIPNSNFTGGAPLENYATTYRDIDNTNDDPTADSTTPNTFVNITDDDNNDNGRRVATRGIVSNLITLVLDQERSDEGTGEPVGDKDPTDLDGTDAGGDPITVENSDLTVDFGFYLPMSLGNFVWVDTNNNGEYEPATEDPVDDGVTLTLYRDTDGSLDFSVGDVAVDDPDNPGNPYQVSTTDGYYLFDNIPPGDNYIVVIDQSNFTPGAGILDGYLSSDNGGAGFEDDTDDDLNDNGRDGTDPFTDGGIPSGLIALEYGTEPVSEATSGNSADGPNGRGNNGELDNNSNLTVDFGVYPSEFFSIGNRVWQDTGANSNDGIFDSDEVGIANVIMNLFRDSNMDGVPDTTTPEETTTTDASGYYLFDSLPSDSYIVSVAPENFEVGGVLRGFSPSAVAANGENDDTDNTSDHNNTDPDEDFGIYSNYYTLEIPEPVSPTETDPTPANLTQDPGTDPSGNPIPDNQSNLTVDFGFVRTLTLGNLVWFDINQDGVYNPGDELGIGDVTVELYEDTNGNNVYDDDGSDNLIATDVTDGNGFYLFNSLEANNYFVHIPYTNWTNVSGTGPLFGFESTTDATAGDVDDDNDNGLGTGDNDPTDGITSEILTLNFGAAPTGESTLSNNDDDGPEYRGVNNPPDNNSDLTRDFGFFLGTPMSIGNIVWIDDGGTTGTANDGIRDGDEVGVDNVLVELYRDSDEDGDPDTNTPLDTTVTGGGGYYLFDGLPPGSYVVVIPEDNFVAGAPLDGYSSTADGTPDIDDNDNGSPSGDDVISGTIVLEPGTEPTDPTPADPLNGDDEDSEEVTGTGANGELDEDSNLTVDFGFIQTFDWGDAPDTYGTDSSATTVINPISDSSDEIGPSHRIVANLYLGDGVDDEADGQPVPVTDPKTSNNTGDPDGDGTDEDGMDFPNFIAGTTVTVDVTAVNNTGADGTLIGWFDWDGNGVFDADEAFEVAVPNGTDGIVQLEVEIPIDAEDLTGGQTYVRLRLTTDSISASEPTGPKNSGEVEDYLIDVEDPGLLVNKTDGLNSIIAGEVNTYTITIENSGEERIGVRFYDELQVATDSDPNGYDPETITWECVGTNGALCISNPASGTDGTTASDGPFDEDAEEVIIDELIDLPRDGIVTYTISARVNPQAGLDGSNTPLINVAQLPNEDPVIEDDDETAVIYDPPFGVKVGELIDADANIIRWTMTWYNPGATQTDVVISDTLGDGQSFPDSTADINLQCSGSDGSCSIEGDDTVVWEGTMFNSTEDDDDEAVIIAFNVLVEEDGTYNNDATLEFTTTDVTAEADASLRIRNGQGEDVSDEEDVVEDPGFTQEPPFIVKSVDTPFTLPGAEVVWTITAVNDSGSTANNVAIVDNVPDTLTIIDAETSSGDLTVDGQTVTVKQDSLANGETITITVTTEINDDVEIPFAINNPALLTCDCNEERNAIATVLSVLELPATGETPWWRDALIATLMGGLLLGGGYVGYRRKISNS